TVPEYMQENRFAFLLGYACRHRVSERKVVGEPPPQCQAVSTVGASGRFATTPLSPPSPSSSLRQRAIGPCGRETNLPPAIERPLVIQARQRTKRVHHLGEVAARTVVRSSTGAPERTRFAIRSAHAPTPMSHHAARGSRSN